MKKRSMILWLLAAVLLFSACGREDAATDAANKTGTDAPATTIAEEGYIPRVFIHYEDEQYDSSAALTAVRVGQRDIALPHGSEQLCTVMLADTGGEVRLAIWEENMTAVEGAEFYTAEQLTGLTLTAYPIDENGDTNRSPEAAQTIAVEQGRFSLPAGKHYYELTLPREGNTLTYGFIAHRVDAEQYRVSEHRSGCMVEYEYEDPDHATKQLPAIHLHTQLGREGGLWGMLLTRFGEVVHTYVNFAGTTVTRRTDLGEPHSEEIHLVNTSLLLCEYEIEWPYDKTVTAAHYTRYAADGTPLGGETLVAADTPRVSTVKLQPHSYYVFTVQYADISTQYVLQTGMALDEIAPHPMDDPACDPALARLLRAEHVQYYHLYLETPDSVGVYIKKYLGRVGGMEAVVFGEQDACDGAEDIRLYDTHMFYTLTQAQEDGWITAEEAATLQQAYRKEPAT